MIGIENVTTVKKLDLLKVVFDTQIKESEIIGFRGALVEKIGLEHEWFHNHANTEEGKKFHYRYPKVQYKRLGSHPMLLFLGDGVREAQHFFSQSSWDLTINKQFHVMRIKQMEERRFDLKVRTRPFRYKIYNWQALNQGNYRTWNKTESLVERVQKLEGLLVAHIISFAKGVSWNVPEYIDVVINEITGVKNKRFKNINSNVFDIRFSTNVNLPEFIGLGKGASRGRGIIRYDHKNLNGYGI